MYSTPPPSAICPRLADQGRAVRPAPLVASVFHSPIAPPLDCAVVPTYRHFFPGRWRFARRSLSLTLVRTAIGYEGDVFRLVLSAL